MSISLRIAVILVAIILILITLMSVKKERMPVKYSLIWLFSGFIILFVGLVPSTITIISNLLGFENMSNMVIGLFIFVLLLITMALTIIVSKQKKIITLLIQEISILKEKNK